MKLAAAILAAGMAFAAFPAHAQVYSIGSNPQGSVAYSIASAVAKIGSLNAGAQYRTAPYAGSSTLVPLVGKGELEFGIANGAELTYAYQGTELFPAPGFKDIRMVAVILPVLGSYAVRTDSDIRTIADLKGRRVPTEYTAGRILHLITEAMLSTADLTGKDLKGVPTPNFVEGIEDLISGKVEAAYIPFNAASGQKAMASIRGGWRFIPVGDTPAAAEKMAKALPSARPTAVSPGKTALGVVLDPTHLFTVDLNLFASSTVPDDSIYALVKALHRNRDELVKVHPSLAGFEPKRMGLTHPVVPYHAGAAKFYKEAGM